jgi:5,10-methylenetetrahydromethanopterin reductase
MRIGSFAQAASGGTLDQLVAEAVRAEADGLASFWVPQIFELDALTAIALMGRETSTIEIGTAVIPTYPRHPWVMAQQALTTNVAVGGRLALGIGLSHQVVVEGMWGLSFDQPLAHMRDYLGVLNPLLSGEGVNLSGERFTARGGLAVHGSTRPQLLIAALGPKMLELAGRETDGTITWCVGPETLAGYTIPTMTAAAEAAGRPTARTVAALPVCVTNDPDSARARAASVFAIYGQLPSYRAMLDREGAAGPADIVLAGSATEIHDRIAGLADVGVTDFVAVEFSADPGEQEATRAVLRSLL